MRPRRCTGVTLVELMVVLVMLGLMAAVVGLSWRNDSSREAAAGGPNSIAAARHQALLTAHVVRVDVSVDDRIVTIAALPDGRIIAPAGLAVDYLTGVVGHD